MTKYDLYKSITLFLLYQVPENTSASDVEIYKVWRNMSGNFLVDDTFVASLLEYVHAKKHEDRNVMKALAQIDGFMLFTFWKQRENALLNQILRYIRIIRSVRFMIFYSG